MDKIHATKAKFRYSPINPLRSLSRAIDEVEPDLVIPSDDRVVAHLHRLYSQGSNSTAEDKRLQIIQRSLGDPSGFSITSSRGRLLQLSKQLGIRVPETAIINNLDELKSWTTAIGFPAVIKIDGTWGGSGVRIANSWISAKTAFLELTRPLSGAAILRHLSVHNLFPLFAQDRIQVPEITVQRYIEGSPANAMFACFKGEVIDELSVETLFSVEQLGSSSIVRTISNPEMSRAGRILIDSLGISGFCGLDFMIDSKTGVAYLIELNPRVTQLGHLELGSKQNLVSALYRSLIGDKPQSIPPFTPETIAFFPHSLRCNPSDPIFAIPNLRHDIPWDEPELVRELIRKPWSSRHISALPYAVVRKMQDSRARLHIRRDLKKK